MENTLENKSKFFALYIWQRVFTCYEYENEIKILDPIYFNAKDKILNHWLVNKYYLQLKALSSITDEDLVSTLDIPEGWEIFKTYNIKKDGYSAVKIRIPYEDNELRYNDDGFKYEIKTLNVGLASISDLLRSKGYALPWMGLSVEKQIEYGWIKLK